MNWLSLLLCCENILQVTTAAEVTEHSDRQVQGYSWEVITCSEINRQILVLG